MNNHVSTYLNFISLISWTFNRFDIFLALAFVSKYIRKFKTSKRRHGFNLINWISSLNVIFSFLSNCVFLFVWTRDSVTQYQLKLSHYATDWELRRSAELQLTQLLKFVLISHLEISPKSSVPKSGETSMIILSDTLSFIPSTFYKSQRIEEKMWKNSKKESEL